jgi:hypothetical protein
LKDKEFEKLQNDDRRLHDFIRDKYEMRRFAPKGKDPMTLIYEGKEPNIIKKETNSDDSFQDVNSDDEIEQ